MDDSKRQAYLDRTRLADGELQKIHLEAIERLEQQGVDLDVLTDLFGPGVLHPNTYESRQALAFFGPLYAAIEAEKPYIAVLCLSDWLDRSLVLGHPGEYERKVNLSLYCNLRNDQVKFSKDNDAPKVIINAPATTIGSNGVRVDADEATDLLGLYEVMPGIKTFSWLGGRHIEGMGTTEEVHVLSASNVTSLFRQVDMHIETRPRSVRASVLGIYNAFEDWMNEHEPITADTD